MSEWTVGGLVLIIAALSGYILLMWDRMNCADWSAGKSASRNESLTLAQKCRELVTQFRAQAKDREVFGQQSVIRPQMLGAAEAYSDAADELESLIDHNEDTR